MKDSFDKIPVPPSQSLASKIQHRSEFYSGNMMLNTGTLSIERISYYTEGDDPEASWQLAKEDAANAILAEVYREIRPCIKELIRELTEAPESKRRNRCLVLVSRIAEITASAQTTR